MRKSKVVLVLTTNFVSFLQVNKSNDVPKDLYTDIHEKYTITDSFNDSISTLEFTNISKWKKNEGNNVYYELYLNQLRLLKYYIDSEDDNEDKICHFFEELVDKIYFDDFLNLVFNSLNDAQKFDMLSALLNSDINIFVAWYKRALMVCANSNDCTIAKKSENILNLYKKDFEAVSCM